jgi:hypothetical protein
MHHSNPFGTDDTHVTSSPAVLESFVNTLIEQTDTGNTDNDLHCSSNVNRVITTQSQLYEEVCSELISFFLQAKNIHNLPHSTAKALTESTMQIIRRFTSHYSQLINLQQTRPFAIDTVFEIAFNELLTKPKIASVLYNTYDHVPPQEHTFPDFHDKLYFVPVKQSLATIASNHNLLQYLIKLSSNSSFFFTPYFLQKIKPLSDKAIYIALYTDEVELTNPIGVSKGKHKIVVVYYSILNFPPWLNSHVDNIFLLGIGKQKLLDNVGSQRFFQPIIDDLKFAFHNGLILGQMTLTVIVCFVCGDNLSMHGLIGMRKGMYQMIIKLSHCGFGMPCKRLTNATFAQKPMTNACILIHWCSLKQNLPVERVSAGFDFLF